METFVSPANSEYLLAIRLYVIASSWSEGVGVVIAKPEWHRDSFKTNISANNKMQMWAC
jgi:hypothetical protein